MAAAPEKAPRGTDVKRARIRALAFLVIAGVAALGVAALLTRYLDRRVAAVRVPTQKVVVAASDLRVATKLQAEHLTQVDWPVASLPQGTSANVQELTGKVVNVEIAKGEPILRTRITSGEGGRGALSIMLPAGMRAVAVRVDDVVGVAGFVHPGDHVDVIVTMRPTERGEAPFASKIILQNVRVLAVGKEVDGTKDAGRDPGKPVSATVATLMVDSQQAEHLALAASKGQLLLALRSAVDATVVATTGIQPPELLGWKAPAPVRAPARPLPRVFARTAIPETREAKMIEILRGDMFEQRDFEKTQSTKGGRP